MTTPFDTAERIADVLMEVSFPNIDFDVVSQGTHVYMQITCKGIDNVTGLPMDWKGRKWLMSEHMTNGEIVQTALAAVIMAYEHEIREMFKYKGESIFDPHYDIDQLHQLRAKASSLKERS